jgi:integrase
MAKPLTPISIAALKARAHRYEVSDGGCQGLRIVVHPSKRKSFIVRFRFRGLNRKLTLGPVLLTHNGEAEPIEDPKADTPLSLVAARELCAKALRQAKADQDPTETKRRKREEQRAAEADTLQQIAEEFVRREGGRLRTLDQRKADLALLYPALGRLPLEQIRRGQYVRVFDRIADERGPVRADRALMAAKVLLAWHANRSEFISPLSGVKRRTSIAERSKTRILSDDELRKLWTTAEKDETPFGRYLQFVLLTATRRSEAAGLRRSELSPDGTVWVIPSARYKTARDTLIPLSKAAQKIVASMPVLAGGDHVFSSSGKFPLSDFAGRKAQFDKAAGFSGWTIHDVRRTARTLMSKAGISPDIAERCLGHALVGVRATYDRHQFEDEKRHAFEALSALIERVVHPPEAEVTELAVTRKRRQRL